MGILYRRRGILSEGISSRGLRSWGILSGDWFVIVLCFQLRHSVVIVGIKGVRLGPGPARDPPGPWTRPGKPCLGPRPALGPVGGGSGRGTRAKPGRRTSILTARRRRAVATTADTMSRVSAQLSLLPSAERNISDRQAPGAVVSAANAARRPLSRELTQPLTRRRKTHARCACAKSTQPPTRRRKTRAWWAVCRGHRSTETTARPPREMPAKTDRARDFISVNELPAVWDADVDAALVLRHASRQQIKGKVRYLLQRPSHESDSWPEALYTRGSGSWLARANDTAAHYATIHCPRHEYDGSTSAFHVTVRTFAWQFGDAFAESIA